MIFAFCPTNPAITDNRKPRRATRTFPLFLAAAMIFAGRAGATVYEIADDGSVHAGTSGRAIPGASTGGVSDPVAAMPDAAPDVPSAAITTIADADVPADYRQPLLSASSRYDLSPRFVAALTRQESAWRATIVSPKGAYGLTQLMPATARALAVDPRDPSANLDGGARYLRILLDRFDGNIEQALAAYNAGPGRVIHAGGVPAIPETRAYVASIIGRLGLAAAGGGR